ncbi:MAG: CBS domain-containing protein [Methanobacteriota archaeon]|nr:MAG: CBS domain-containing protein [Euryarchaeota archaeon]
MTAAERESLDAPQRYPGGQAMVFVRDVMTRDVIVIDPDRTVLDAAKRMAAKKIGGLVVVQHGRPIGLITDRDILWQVTSKEKNPSKILVRDVMTSPVATVSPLTTLRAAARVMLDKKTRWVVVTHLDNVEGIITASDLTWGFLETFARASKRGIAPR